MSHLYWNLYSKVASIPFKVSNCSYLEIGFSLTKNTLKGKIEKE